MLTVRPPKGVAETPLPYRVSRFPVLRDRSGYVRGYLQYLSFDIPLAFRLLFHRRPDAVIVEPPPTSACVTALVCRLRRIPFFPYAADVWSDASEGTSAGGAVVRVVRGMERWAWNGARGVFSVNDGVTARVSEIADRAVVETVGNGVDDDVFNPDGPRRDDGRYVIYTGTASEWQGADVFVRAMAELRDEIPDARLVFLGQGSAWPELRELAESTGARVDFVPSVPAAEAATWLRGARASLASMRPGAGYDFAYPTKVFASWATGTPVVYAGPGPAGDTLRSEPMLGAAVPFDASAAAAAIREALAASPEPRPEVAAWAGEHVTLRGVAARVREFMTRRLAAGAQRGGKKRAA
ncbi:glycosyltransferase [Leucobacter sp. CSA2]|uniref:D-inositol 3-phosphate glycosyltransferase n=2 Tax=Leucobacter edaphi TaxID=2796472 RepID=A0A934QD56_9MICO|nr:glycosyltransferase [Leucobacter edaphi]MBK0421630.1 glycosyltransferase [Leucobacter edaphi]